MPKRRKRAFFTRRSTAPGETLMWGLRGSLPPLWWAQAGALPGANRRKSQRELLLANLKAPAYV
jgi:hypothetical protein